MRSLKACLWRLRFEFNERGFLGRAARGEVIERVVDQSLPSDLANQPLGTVSQFVRYETPDGIILAKAHRYLRGDGRLGGGGSMDPKWLRTAAAILKPAHDDREKCGECPTWKPKALGNRECIDAILASYLRRLWLSNAPGLG